jgi:tripartite-type tricarboxylate transporter receptor subunit TctC
MQPENFGTRSRRWWAAGLLIMAAAAGWSPALHAQYPEKVIRLVVPFPPGGAVDTIARLLTQKIGLSLGQPVIIENRGGAGGAIAAEAVAKSAPDGYTLLIGTASTHGTNSSAYKISYDPVRDFSPISLIATTPFILVAHPSVPASNAAELVAYAKAHPKSLNVSSFGSGSSNHLAAELFKAQSGTDIVHVPYKGAAPAMADLIAGRIHIMFDTFPTSLPQLDAGRIKLLGVGSLKRASVRPAVPTISESGVPGYEATTWFAIFAPAGTPRPVVGALSQRFRDTVAQSEVHERLLAMGLEPVGSSPEELQKRVEHEVVKWQTLVRERNLKFD